MTPYERLINCPYNYDADVCIHVEYEASGIPACYYSEVYRYDPFEEETGLWVPGAQTPIGEGAASEVNAWLKAYRLIDKLQGEDMPFDACWNYRLRSPEWTVFRSWLFFYYEQRMRDTGRSLSERARAVILESNTAEMALQKAVRPQLMMLEYLISSYLRERED